MFTAAEKLLLLAALEGQIASLVRAQKAARFPDMAPVFEKNISVHRALYEKVNNVKADK